MVTSSIRALQPINQEVATRITTLRYGLLLFIPIVLLFAMAVSHFLRKKIKQYPLRLLLEVVLTIVFMLGYAFFWNRL